MIASAKNKSKIGIRECRVTAGRKGYYFFRYGDRGKTSAMWFLTWMKWRSEPCRYPREKHPMQRKHHTKTRDMFIWNRCWILLGSFIVFLWKWSYDFSTLINEYDEVYYWISSYWIILASLVWLSHSYSLFFVLCQTGFIKILYAFLHILSNCF